MNKNSIIGFALIGLILIGFSVYNSKIYKEQARERFVQDSIAAAQAFEEQAKLRAEMLEEDPSSAAKRNVSLYKDSLLNVASEGEEQFYVLENENLKITYTNKGAQPSSIQLKKYSSYQVLLIDDFLSGIPSIDNTAVFFQLLKEREKAGNPTIIGTQYDPQEWPKMLSGGNSTQGDADAIRRRLVDKAYLVVISKEE